MNIHFLDFVMYLVFLLIILFLLGKEYTEELGGLVGFFVIIIYTIIYIVFFMILDFNWIDIFKKISFNLNFTW